MDEGAAGGGLRVRLRALLGAGPGPLYALIGTGVIVLVVSLASAVGGAWLYGHLRARLPH